MDVLGDRGVACRLKKLPIDCAIACRLASPNLGLGEKMRGGGGGWQAFFFGNKILSALWGRQVGQILYILLPYCVWVCWNMLEYLGVANACYTVLESLGLSQKAKRTFSFPLWNTWSRDGVCEKPQLGGRGVWKGCDSFTGKTLRAS